jgi:hypothetical protein
LQFTLRMRALTPGLVVAVGLIVGWSTVQAAPRQEARRHKKAKRPVESPTPTPADDTADATDGPDAKPDAKPDTKPDAKTATKKVALESGATVSDGIDEDDAGKEPARLAKVAPAPAGRGWQIAIGPYLWASSVDANVSLGGPVSTGADIGFIPLERHARYGAEILAEVRHGRFAISGDLMYGAAAVTGSTSIASAMVTLTGNASSLLVDGAASYQVLGDEDALFSLEARAGIRYQRTVVSGAVSLAGAMLQTPDAVDDGSDVLVGTRAVLRPTHRVFLSGMFDVGVAGVSNSTWSATADAGVRVTSHVQVMAGWRTLVMERSLVSLTLHGPRVAMQLVF